MKIPSKKSRIPTGRGFHLQSMSQVELSFGKERLSFYAVNEEDEKRFIKTLREQTRGTLYVLSAGEPEQSYVTSRFIGKLALEILAYRFMDVSGWNDEIVDKQELDELRSYVRKGKPDFVWPVNIRRLYDANHQFSDELDPVFQVLHEWDLLFIPDIYSNNAN
ncbi:MAG: hypothetical protein PVG39_13220, partial [Desulfobacteraceae bacterium]